MAIHITTGRPWRIRSIIKTDRINILKPMKPVLSWLKGTLWLATFSWPKTPIRRADPTENHFSVYCPSKQNPAR